MVSSFLPIKLIKRSRTPLHFSLAVLAVLVIIYLTIPGVQEFLKEAYFILISDDEQRIKTWVNSFSWFGPLLLVIAMIFQMFFIFIPTLVLMIVCVLAYGPIYGSAIVFVAIYFASSVGYIIGRYLGTALVERIIGQKLIEKGSDFLHTHGFWAIFISRINPFLSNDAVSFISGVLKMGYGKFIWANLAGIVPLILLIAVLGESSQSLKWGLFWISLITLLILLIYIFFKKRLRKIFNLKATTS